MPPLLVRAGWLIADSTHVVRDGAVLIGDDGRVAWRGRAAAAPTAEREEYEAPDAVAVAGFVNTHTHLELTHLEGLVTEPAFPEWIARLRELKEETTSDEFAAAARMGLAGMLAQGVTTVADTGSTGAAASALAELGGRGIVYQEVFGPDPSQTDEALAGLTEALDRLAPFVSDKVGLGVSPHAPYTVSGQLARGAAELAARRGLPIAIHTAESHAEAEFIRSGAGPFGESHVRRGIPVKARGRSTVAWLAELGILGARCLCVHGVTTDEEDVALLAEAGASVAHCPLSNEAHGHGRAPLALWERYGVAVGLGTDSAASQAPLDLRAEARATGASHTRQLDLLTASGARALGLSDVGALHPGQWGDVAVVAAGDGADPVAAALTGRVVLTVVGGRVVHDARQPSDAVAATWVDRVANARRRLEAIAGERAASR